MLASSDSLAGCADKCYVAERNEIDICGRVSRNIEDCSRNSAGNTVRNSLDFDCGSSMTGSAAGKTFAIADMLHNEQPPLVASAEAFPVRYEADEIVPQLIF